jgi:hypothetical protein
MSKADFGKDLEKTIAKTHRTDLGKMTRPLVDVEEIPAYPPLTENFEVRPLVVTEWG